MASIDTYVVDIQIKGLDQLKALNDAVNQLNDKQKVTTATTTAMADAISKVTTNAAGATSALKNHTAVTDAAGQSSNVLNQRLIVLGDMLLRGRNPAQALAQEFTVLAERTGGFGAAAEAIGARILPVLANPMVLAAAALAAVGVSAAIGAKELDHLNNITELYGLSAGAAGGHIDAMAQSLGVTLNTSTGKARDVLEQLITSGKFTGTAMDNAAQSILKISKMTDESADKVASKLIPALSGGVSGVRQLDEQMHFLSTSQLEAMMVAERHGDSLKVTAIAAEALKDKTMPLEENIGTLGKMFNWTTNQVLGLWEAMKNIGKTDTTEQAIKRASDALQVLTDRKAKFDQHIHGAGITWTDKDQKDLETAQAALGDYQKALRQTDNARAQSEAEAQKAETAKRQLMKQEPVTQSGKVAMAQAEAARIGQIDIDEAEKSNNEVRILAAKAARDISVIKAGARVKEDYDGISLAKQTAAAEEEITTKLAAAVSNIRIRGDIKAINDASLSAIQYRSALELQDAEKTMNLIAIQRAKANGDIAKKEEELRQEAVKDGLDKTNQLANYKMLREAEMNATVAAEQRRSSVAEDQRIAVINKTTSEMVAKNAAAIASRGLTVEEVKLNEDLAKSITDQAIEIQHINTLKDEGRISDAIAKADIDKINAAYLAQRAIIQKNADDAKAVRQDGVLGAQDAFNQIVKSMDPYALAQARINSMWGTMGSAIDNFVMTGKFSFEDLTRSVLQDLLKIELKTQALTALKAVTGSGGILSTIGSMLGFADGGEPPVGKPSIVGERGPEVFVPKTAGTIVPMTAGAGANQSTTNNYHTYNISAIDSRSVAQMFAENRKSLLGTVQLAQKELPYSNR